MNRVAKIISISAAGLLGLAGLMRSCTTVPAGHVTVLSTFGNVHERELESGLQFPVNPFAARIPMETRTKEIKEAMQVPTKEGMIAGLDVSVLYKIDASKADEIYRTLGTNYQDVVLVPNLRNVTRDVVAEFFPEDLYGQNRTKIASEITARLKDSYAQRGIVLESILLRDVRLPDRVTQAIEQKIQSKQQAEQMQYVLQKEEQEAQRKRLEARGIADAQQIIAESLTPEYLQWRYITTLEGLTNSQNTTFVITPYDEKLIPFLPLNPEKARDGKLVTPERTQ